MKNKEGKKTMTGHEGHLGLEMSSATKNERLKVSVEFQEQLKMVFNNYIKLKDALVIDDAINVNKEAKNTLASLTKVDMSLLKDEKAHVHWMSFDKEIKSSVTSISEVTDIKEQRSHFKHLSVHLISVIETYGINEKVYSQFCPMADNNNGAYWLSREEKVVNPYFGAAMLTCGSVKQTIE